MTAPTEGEWFCDRLEVRASTKDRPAGVLLASLKRTPVAGDEAEANAHVFAAAKDMLAVLKSIEWSASVDDEDGGYKDGCPVCAESKAEGHMDYCELARAIAKAEGQS